jgi:hypothetical protein
MYKSERKKRRGLMGLLTTNTERTHKAKRVVVRPDRLHVRVELVVNYGLSDGTLRVVEEYSRLSNAQFVGRVVDDLLVLETVARALVTYGEALDSEYDQVEFTRFDGPQKCVVRRGKDSRKLTIEVGPGGCEYAFVESPFA